MKTLIVCVLSLFSVEAFAGRESHGYLPAAFQCARTGSKYEVVLKVTDGVVMSGLLWHDRYAYPEVPCTDYGFGRAFNNRMETTAFCGSKRSPTFRLELMESRTESQVRVWKLDGNRQVYLDTLSCQ